MHKVTGERSRGGRARYPRQRHQGAGLGREGKATLGVRHEQGLFARSIARQREGTAASVPYGDGKHAIERLGEALAAFLIQLRQQRRVRAIRNDMAALA